MLFSRKTNRIGILHLCRSIHFRHNDLSPVLRVKSIRFVSQKHMFLQPPSSPSKTPTLGLQSLVKELVRLYPSQYAMSSNIID
jgi:hypothetical protein